uniref:Uncharacterized protein n=1 Tax=Mycena chlorophos TaxID=658473 RepID=A0ABQ0L4M9_MYCCL|nr:predicted protein [Mycena chlorophos]
MPRAPSLKKAPAAALSNDKPSPKKKAIQNPGLRKRQAAWRNQLRLWSIDSKFKHPPGTKTVATKAAKDDYHLNDEELQTLPYEKRPSGSWKPMILYAHNDLFNLARDKSIALETPLVIGKLKYLTMPGPAGTASVARIQNLRPPTTPQWLKDQRNPQPPPLKDTRYTPITAGDKPDPDLRTICWLPSDIPELISVGDACWLYCIQPSDIQDLAAASRWIHTGTVARRAVQLHGGFYAHYDHVSKCREQEEQRLHEKYAGLHVVNNRRGDFEFSAHVKAYQANIDHDWEMMHEVPGERDKLKRVAVLESGCLIGIRSEILRR